MCSALHSLLTQYICKLENRKRALIINSRLAQSKVVKISIDWHICYFGEKKQTMSIYPVYISSKTANWFKSERIKVGTNGKPLPDAYLIV
jgi:hypothetical protein